MVHSKKDGKKEKVRVGLVGSPNSFKMKDAKHVPCASCIYRVKIPQTWNLMQCRHPRVIEIEHYYPERGPGVGAANALNKMGKALNLRINPNALKRKFFSWPWSYLPSEIEDCSTKVAVHELAYIALGYTRGPRDTGYQVKEGSIEELKGLVDRKDDRGIIDWFKHYFPGCMEFVSSKRLTFAIYSRVFLEGFWQAIEDGRVF